MKSVINFLSDNLYVILAVVGLIALAVVELAIVIHESGGFV